MKHAHALSERQFELLPVRIVYGTNLLPFEVKHDVLKKNSEMLIRVEGYFLLLGIFLRILFTVYMGGCCEIASNCCKLEDFLILKNLINTFSSCLCLQSYSPSLSLIPSSSSLLLSSLT